jgi:hypothetical protein
MFLLPDDFLRGPFSRRAAITAGVPERVLEGTRFRRLHQGVYCHRGHVLTWRDHVRAAGLALPGRARTTGATRLRELGLEVGEPFPLHFVIEGDLHLVLEGVFLHRTVKMPPHNEEGVTAEAAFVAFCAEARTIDAIKAGSVLLHLKLMDLRRLEQLLTDERWRRGVPEASYVLPFLDARCRSLTEAELLTYVVFAGLPMPEVNEKVTLADGTELTPDQRFADYDLVLEYEGSHHQEDRRQYNADIDRYAAYRRNDVPYEQVTKERLRSPKATVRTVHRALVNCGYDGPPPDFDGLWLTLFLPLRDVVRNQRRVA